MKSLKDQNEQIDVKPLQRASFLEDAFYFASGTNQAAYQINQDHRPHAVSL